jgi:hypothetical protein
MAIYEVGAIARLETVNAHLKEESEMRLKMLRKAVDTIGDLQSINADLLDALKEAVNEIKMQIALQHDLPLDFDKVGEHNPAIVTARAAIERATK